MDGRKRRKRWGLLTLEGLEGRQLLSRTPPFLSVGEIAAHNLEPAFPKFNRIEHRLSDGGLVTLSLYGPGSLKGTVFVDDTLYLSFSGTDSRHSALVGRVSGGTGRAKLGAIVPYVLRNNPYSQTGSGAPPITFINLHQFDLQPQGVINLLGGIGAFFLGSAGPNTTINMKQGPISPILNSLTRQGIVSTSPSGLQIIPATTVGVTLPGGSTFAGYRETWLARGIGIPAGRAMLNLTWAPPERPEAPDPRTLDSDGDGVRDADDVCDTTPQGSLPDPSHPGCPLADADGDNVGDTEDACPQEPQGARPDPARRGCPQRDRDSDGVFDADDACPEAALGTRPDSARRGCPLGDRDGDGVSDPDDLCPDTPQGQRPDPVRRGCVFEVADGDSDLVPDADDACPNQAGVASLERATHGCPNALVELASGVLRTRRPVAFNPRRPNVRSVSRAQIDAVADVLRAAPSLRRVSVDVHGDGSGRPERALELSERRAALLMRMLIQRGVAAERLEAHGLGNQRPIGSAESSDGRARNERVEFRIVDVGFAAAATAITPPPPDAPASPGPARRRGHHGGARRHRR